MKGLNLLIAFSAFTSSAAAEAGGSVGFSDIHVFLSTHLFYVAAAFVAWSFAGVALYLLWKRYRTSKQVIQEINDLDERIVNSVQAGDLSAGHVSLDYLEKANELALRHEYSKAEDYVERAKRSLNMKA